MITILNFDSKTTPIYEPARLEDIHDSFADSSRARNAFGYDPRHTVKTGLQETIVQ